MDAAGKREAGSGNGEISTMEIPSTILVNYCPMSPIPYSKLIQIHHCFLRFSSILMNVLEYVYLKMAAFLII